MLVLFIVIAMAISISFSFAVWRWGSVAWLQNICTCIVWSYPFERILSLTIGGSTGLTVRFSQIFTLTGLGILVILLLRKDKNILNITINPLTWPLLAFIVFGIPSWYYIERPTRFFTTMIATLISFGAAFLLAHFTQDVFQRIKDISLVMIFASIFGVYQVFGDLVGLPQSLTLLDDQYTKEILGIARAQGTALEPLYFAGMLFLPIVASFIFIQTQDKIRVVKNQILNSLLQNNTLLLSLFLSVFLLTNSKSAIVTLVGLLIILLFSLRHNLSLTRVAPKLLKITTLGGFIIGFLVVYVPRTKEVLNELWRLFWFTLQGRSSTALDRGLFLDIALGLLPRFSITGMGSGQYAHWARPLVWFAGIDQYLIVNNVYLEVWLEHGFIPFIIFCGMLLALLYRGFVKTLRGDINNRNIKAITILTFSLLAYCIQWLTFSPIFIMPIFIIMGLLAREVWNTPWPR